MRCLLLLLVAACLVEAQAGPDSHALASGRPGGKIRTYLADRKQSQMRHLLATTSDTVCARIVKTNPAKVAKVCPAGMVEDNSDGDNHCWGACSTLNTRTTKYSIAGDPTLCLPTCLAGQMAIQTSDTSVKCALCPDNYVWIQSKSTCYQKCGTGAMALYPEKWETGDLMCAKKCPKAFPTAVSATKCVNSAGLSTTRSAIARTSKSGAITTRNAINRPDVDKACSPSTEMLDGDDTCYNCPGSIQLSQDTDGNAICISAKCPSEMVECGNYCYNEGLSDGLGQWDEDSCASFLDLVADCIDAC